MDALDNFLNEVRRLSNLLKEESDALDYYNSRYRQLTSMNILGGSILVYDSLRHFAVASLLTADRINSPYCVDLVNYQKTPSFTRDRIVVSRTDNAMAIAAKVIETYGFDKEFTRIIIVPNNY